MHGNQFTISMPTEPTGPQRQHRDVVTAIGTIADSAGVAPITPAGPAATAAVPNVPTLVELLLGRSEAHTVSPVYVEVLPKHNAVRSLHDGGLPLHSM